MFVQSWQNNTYWVRSHFMQVLKQFFKKILKYTTYIQYGSRTIQLYRIIILKQKLFVTSYHKMFHAL